MVHHHHLSPRHTIPGVVQEPKELIKQSTESKKKTSKEMRFEQIGHVIFLLEHSTLL
jgi:hypothetical protein